MKFEIPFDEKIYKKQMEIYFQLNWENRKKNNRLYNYFGFVLLILGILLLIETNSSKITVPAGFIIGGVLCLMSYYKFYIPYLKSKRKFNLEVDRISKEYTENPWSEIEFMEDGITVKDYTGELKLLWSSYNFYRIIGTTLIVIGKDRPIAIDEVEIGFNNFQKIIEIVDVAVKKTTAKND